MSADETEIADAYLRALKDGGDTDLWAARTLHAAGIHTVDIDGKEVPITPSMLEVQAVDKGEGT